MVAYRYDTSVVLVLCGSTSMVLINSVIVKVIFLRGTDGMV